MKSNNSRKGETVGEEGKSLVISKGKGQQVRKVGNELDNYSVNKSEVTEGRPLIVTMG